MFGPTYKKLKEQAHTCNQNSFMTCMHNWKKMTSLGLVNPFSSLQETDEWTWQPVKKCQEQLVPTYYEQDKPVKPLFGNSCTHILMY